METNGKGTPTVFEIETAIAFLYFRKMKCEYVVLETGLGGRLDATNIIQNTILAVFAAISRDHMGFLGDTLPEIAAEKAGIIKPGCTVVSSPQETEVRAVLEQTAAERGCPIRFAGTENMVVSEEGYRGQTISCCIGNPVSELLRLHIRLAGKYQIQNAATALEAIAALRGMGVQISGEAVRRGLEQTEWPGRFTCICENPVFIVDGAHNEDAARRLRETLEAYFPGTRFIYIMGVFKDKEYEKISAIMAPMAKKIYTIDLPDKNRTLDAQSLKAVLDAQSLKNTPETQSMKAGMNRSGEETLPIAAAAEVEAVGSIRKAVESALKAADKEDVIVAFGSLSYLGQVMEMLKEI